MRDECECVRARFKVQGSRLFVTYTSSGYNHSVMEVRMGPLMDSAKKINKR